MKSFFQFNPHDITLFMQQIKAKQALQLASKSAFYDFDFVKGEPLKDEGNIHSSKSNKRFIWESIETSKEKTKEARSSLKNQDFSANLYTTSDNTQSDDILSDTLEYKSNGRED